MPRCVLGHKLKHDIKKYGPFYAIESKCLLDPNHKCIILEAYSEHTYKTSITMRVNVGNTSYYAFYSNANGVILEACIDNIIFPKLYYKNIQDAYDKTKTDCEMLIRLMAFQNR